MWGFCDCVSFVCLWCIGLGCLRGAAVRGYINRARKVILLQNRDVWGEILHLCLLLALYLLNRRMNKYRRLEAFLYQYIRTRWGPCTEHARYVENIEATLCKRPVVPFLRHKNTHLINVQTSTSTRSWTTLRTRNLDVLDRPPICFVWWTGAPESLHGFAWLWEMGLVWTTLCSASAKLSFGLSVVSCDCSRN